MGTHGATDFPAGCLEPYVAGLPRLEGRVLHIFLYEASVFGGGGDNLTCEVQKGDVWQLEDLPTQTES